jgi:tetratricopeptide (TPR) repeat protein
LVSGLGYEKDETWDLSTPTKSINVIISNNIKINENEIPSTHSYNPKTLNSVAFDNDLSSLTRRYHELLDIVSSDSSPELIEFLDSWAFLGFIHRNAYDEALRIIDKLISNRPRDAQWNYYKAFCLQCLGRGSQDAVKHYGIALDNGAEEFWVRYNRGKLFLYMRETEKAYIDLERAVLLYPTHQCAHKLLDKMKEIRLPH